MMKILFLTKYYPGSLSKRCSAISKIGLDWAGHNLATAMIRGFRENGAQLQVVNVPQMGSFPPFSRRPMVPAYAEEGVESLAYLNVSYVKRWDSNRRLLHYASRWCAGGGDEQRVVLFYNFEHLGILRQLKHRFPDIRVVLLVTDLPEYMNTRQSLALRINNHISPITRQGSGDHFKVIDGYILLAPDMASRLPVSGKPWLLMEGIYNDEAPKTLQEKRPERIIMYAGNLGRRYGIDRLLDAFALISDSNYRLWIRGNGEMEEEVKARALRDNRITYLAPMSRKSLTERLQQATVMVNPVASTEEFTRYFFPSKTLEYMASGSPTLMCHLACMPSEYDDHLFYFDDESAEGMARRLREVCELPQEELNAFGQAAREFIYREKAPEPQMWRVINFLKSL